MCKHTHTHTLYLHFTDIENKQEVTGGGERGKMGGTGRYKLLGIRQAQGCIVQHEEYSQYFVITVNGI